MTDKSKGLRVEVGPHWTISSIANGGVPSRPKELRGQSSAWFAPRVERFSDDELFLGFSVVADNYFRSPRALAMLLYSEDLGDTWWFNSQNDRGSEIVFEAKDGMRYLYGGTFGRDNSYPVRQGEFSIAPRYLSYDRGRTWEGPQDVRIRVPQAEHAGFYGRPILELADGRLMTATYLHFIGEEHSRVIIIASEDKGRTWEYLSTAGYDDDPDTGECTEPVLMQLASGDLVCVMRREGFCPMSQTFSSDLGQTWSGLEEIPGDGVWPDLCQMESGMVACAYGRPGCNIMFSLDGTCQEWTHQTTIVDTLVTPAILCNYWGKPDAAAAAPYVKGEREPTGSKYLDGVLRRHFAEPDGLRVGRRLDQEQGAWSKGYCSVREIRPGELLYLYGVCGVPQDWRGGPLPNREELSKIDLPTLNSIMATIIKVQRDG